MTREERYKKQEARENKQDTLLETLIGEVRQSHKRTNIKDIDLSRMPCIPEKRIGRILQTAQNISHKEFILSFDPVETTLLQKMITEQTLTHDIILEKEDYLQGMIFLDFFMTYIARDHSIVPQIFGLDKRIERTNDSIGVNLEICTMYTAMQYAARTIQEKKRPASKQAFKRDNIYEEINTNPKPWTHLRPLNPLYLEIGTILSSMLTLPETKEAVIHAKGRADIKALIFMDTNARYLQDTKEKEKSLRHLSRGDFYTSGKRAFYALALES